VWVLDRCAGAKKNRNDLNSASSVHLRVAATTPESPSFAYFLVQRSACYSSCQLFQRGKAITELRIRAILTITPRKLPRGPDIPALRPDQKSWPFSSLGGRASLSHTGPIKADPELPRNGFPVTRPALAPLAEEFTGDQTLLALRESM
jgi:hypothetical protein